MSKQSLLNTKPPCFSISLLYNVALDTSYTKNVFFDFTYMNYQGNQDPFTHVQNVPKMSLQNAMVMYLKPKKADLQNVP